jgi:hypothetical protein
MGTTPAQRYIEQQEVKNGAAAKPPQPVAFGSGPQPWSSRQDKGG